jgi:hypothetical protein
MVKKKRVSRIIENKLSRSEEQFLLKKDGLFLKHRKRTYLYWFKFLQEAQTSEEYKVDWRKYKSWGGSNEVIGSKFDDWWISHWKELFGIKDPNGIPKFNIDGKLNFEQMRLSYLVYELRNIPIDYMEKHQTRYHGRFLGDNKKSVTRTVTKTNKLSIAYRVFTSEMSKDRFTQVARLNPDNSSMDQKQIGQEITKLMNMAKKSLTNVCNGSFP